MRLIDADDAITIFTNRLFEMLKTHLPCVTATENQVCLDTCYKIAKYEIDNISTAYDEEKVVEEMESLSARYGKEDFAIKGIIVKAIDIVKRGGIDE